MEKGKIKQAIKKYIFISFLVFAIIISILLMIKYSVEGEKELTLELKEIAIKSSIGAKDNEGEELWNLILQQDNDIYIYFNKNEQMESKVETIKIENLTVERNEEIGEIAVYLPTSNDVKTNYQNSTENYYGKTIEYAASIIDNMEKQQFNENGGMIAFRISNEEIGTYISNEGEEVQYNKDLLEKAEISQADIKLKVSFDLILEVSEKEKYKGTIELELPAENFEQSGVVTKKLDNFENVVFKRCK